MQSTSTQSCSGEVDARAGECWRSCPGRSRRWWGRAPGWTTWWGRGWWCGRSPGPRGGGVRPLCAGGPGPGDRVGGGGGVRLGVRGRRVVGREGLPDGARAARCPGRGGGVVGRTRAGRGRRVVGLIGCLVLRCGARAPVVGQRGRLRPVGGVPVHRGEGQPAPDEGHGGGDHGPALVLLPAGQLPPPRRPALPHHRRVLDVGGGGGDTGRFTRERLRGRLELPRERGHFGPGGARRGSAGAGWGDVRGVGAAAGAHQRAVEVPSALGAVVHLRLPVFPVRLRHRPARATAWSRSYEGSSGQSR